MHHEFPEPGWGAGPPPTGGRGPGGGGVPQNLTGDFGAAPRAIFGGRRLPGIYLLKALAKAQKMLREMHAATATPDLILVPQAIADPVRTFIQRLEDIIAHAERCIAGEVEDVGPEEFSALPVELAGARMALRMLLEHLAKIAKSRRR